jgi:transcriptional regulator with XRE-family HTH domain
MIDNMVERVASVRASLDMNQTDFGEMLGVLPSQISRWEQGHTGISPRYRRLIKQIEADMNADTGKHIRTAVTEGKIAVLKDVLFRISYEAVRWFNADDLEGAKGIGTTVRIIERQLSQLEASKSMEDE